MLLEEAWFIEVAFGICASLASVFACVADVADRREHIFTQTIIKSAKSTILQQKIHTLTAIAAKIQRAPFTIGAL